ncbi:MAG: SLBB domain-containing protein [Acidobacteriota bacterium]|nr:SLBB domain-containing protein [Acidobacteriota bacterium]
MRFGFLILKLSCVAAVSLAAASASAKIFAQKVEPTPAINQSSAQLSEEKAAKQENGENKSASSAVRLEDLIHLGDVIDIDVLGSLEYDWRGRLDSEGFLSGIPYAKEPVFALCRTEEEIAAQLTEAYSKILRKPEIVVRVVDRTERQQARIYGAVRTPLRFQIERPVRLNEILVLTGGIGERASGEIKIFRPPYLSCISPNSAQAESQMITVKISELLAGKSEANPFIRTGDIVTVEEAKPVFVAGGVAAPQTILLRDNQTMTLTRAIASAGGAVKNAVKVTIFRRSSDGVTQQIEADLEKIRRKQADDVSLEAFDVVEVEGTLRADKTKPPTVAGFDANQPNQANPPLRVIN